MSFLTFLLSRNFAQKDAILAEKRRVYEEFLVNMPSPNDAYDAVDDRVMMERAERMRKCSGAIMLYGNAKVAFAVSRYFQLFAEADEVLGPDSPALHPKYKELAKAQNDLILEMSRDAMGPFRFKGRSRLPKIPTGEQP